MPVGHHFEALAAWDRMGGVAPDGTWVTIIPLTLRNATESPLVLKDVEVIQARGVYIRAIRMVGPQPISILNRIVVGWPVLGPPNPAVAAKEFKPVRGFVIPPAPPGLVVQTEGVARDQPNDASIALHVRRRVGADVGEIVGYRVVYVADGRTFAVEFRDDAAAICDKRDWDASLCASR